jgi:hypothetical protein
MKKKSALSPPIRSTQLTAIASAAAKDFAHEHSATVQSRIRLLQFEGEETDKAITQIAAALTAAKDRRAKIDAMLNGLAEVLEKR